MSSLSPSVPPGTGPPPEDAADPGGAARAAGPSGVDWDALPEPVRQRLAEVAAGALTEMAPADVPAPLRSVARFAPAKRARLGAGPLLAALRDVPRFRVAVVEWAGEHRPAALDIDAADPVAAATAALLVDADDAGERVNEVARRAGDARLRAERDAALARVQRLQAELARLRRDLADARAAAERAGETRQAEVERLQRRLRDQGVLLREARNAAAAAAAETEAGLAETRAALAAASAERDRERERADAERRRADRASADAEAARQAAREARQADEVRLALLVDTVAGAVTGLRRELALTEEPDSGPRPADTVLGASPATGSTGRVEDPAGLDRLLTLRAVHLVVDGYNVTKTGYPELTLAEQRDRLVGQLAALAARTGAEVTVVFDGAGVVSVPVTTPRGVRVLFSDPGVPADDVVRALVSAEPEGRPVVVVTSDRALADSVRRSGAHPVPSAVLLARLARI